MFAAVSGLDMFGLMNEVVQFLLEQLPGIDNCQRYRRRYQETAAKVPPQPQTESQPVNTIFVVSNRP